MQASGLPSTCSVVGITWAYQSLAFIHDGQVGVPGISVFEPKVGSLGSRKHHIRNRELLLDEAARQPVHDAGSRMQTDNLVGIVGIGL